MTNTEQAEAELTWKFMQHHTLDDSRDSYVQNGQWAYMLGYRAGVKAAPPKREWVGLTRDEYHEILGNNWQLSEVIRETEVKLKEKNT